MITGCSTDKEEADKPKEETPIEQITDQDKAKTEIKQNEDLTKKIQDEKSKGACAPHNSVKGACASHNSDTILNLEAGIRER